MIFFHLKFLQANLRGGKGGTFMVAPDDTSPRHWSLVLFRCKGRLVCRL